MDTSHQYRFYRYRYCIVFWLDHLYSYCMLGVRRSHLRLVLISLYAGHVNSNIQCIINFATSFHQLYGRNRFAYICMCDSNVAIKFVTICVLYVTNYTSNRTTPWTYRESTKFNNLRCEIISWHQRIYMLSLFSFTKNYIIQIRFVGRTWNLLEARVSRDYRFLHTNWQIIPSALW